MLLFATGLAWLSVVDWREQRLPRRLIYATALGAGGALAIGSLVGHRAERLWWMLAGAAGSLVAVGLMHAVSRGGLGDGDVRLAGLIGLVLGYWGVMPVVAGLTLGFMLGAIGGLVAVATGRATLRSHIPFGPFLATGALVAAVFHHALRSG